MRALIMLGPLIVALAGCQSFGNALTPADTAQLACILAEDGTALGAATTTGGAQETARTIAGATVAACQAVAAAAAATKPTKKP